MKLEIISNTIDSINGYLSKILILLIFVVFLLIFGEVVARYFFNEPTLWGMTSATWLWGGVSVLSGGYVLKEKGHVRMDIVYSRVSPRMRTIFHFINSIAFFLFVIVLIWAGFKYGWQSIIELEHYGEVWNPPIYPIKATIFIGACLLCLQGIAELIKGFKEILTIE